MRRRLHDLLRRHHRFEQGTTEFYICAPRLRWHRRPTEYTVLFAGHEPVRVTRDQFIHLERRFNVDARPQRLRSLDEVEAELAADETDGDDRV